MPRFKDEPAPKYEWTCHKCEETNSAGVSRCTHCDFPANFRTSDLPTVPVLVTDKQASETDSVASKLWMFLPEGILAAALAVYAPFWAVQRFAEGYAVAPLIVLAAEAVCIWLFVQACHAANKWLAYAAMAIFMVVFFVITPTIK